MKKYVKPEVVETKEYAEGVYLASGGSTDNSSGPEETPVDLAERKQTRVRTPARSALRAAGREIRRFRARSLRAKQILPDVSTADR